MINCFENEYAFLSNFYEHPITYNGLVYPTNEHFFQAMKTPILSEQLEIAAAATPGRAKRLGRKATLWSNWEEIKEDVMLQALRLKFADPALAEKLLATDGEYLIEGNWWHDNYWGVCSCEKCEHQGRNRLGELLMKVREEIKNAED